MRTLAVLCFAMSVPGLAVAQEQNRQLGQKADSCFYPIDNQSVEVPIGSGICRRMPAPYNDQYFVLRCIPPLTEIDSGIKRGDPRCDRYEER